MWLLYEEEERSCGWVIYREKSEIVWLRRAATISEHCRCQIITEFKNSIDYSVKLETEWEFFGQIKKSSKISRETAPLSRKLNMPGINYSDKWLRLGQDLARPKNLINLLQATYIKMEENEKNKDTFTEDREICSV